MLQLKPFFRSIKYKIQREGGFKMYKANGRLSDMMFNRSDVDKQIQNIERLKEEFKREGQFEAFKHTSSYVEIPPITKTIDSGTYIQRRYKGIDLVTLGATLYFVDTPELQRYLRKPIRFKPLGQSGLRVNRVDDSYFYLNEKGREFQQQLIKDWEKLTQPVFGYKHY